MMHISNSAFSVPTFGVVDTSFVNTSVKELPLCPPTLLPLSTPIQEVLPFCRQSNLPPFILVDEQNRFKGVAPLGQVLMQIVPYDTNWLQSSIERCIDAKWPTLPESARVADTYDHLLQGDYHYLPILGGEHSQEVVGILSTQAISSFLVESLADDIMEVYYPE